GAAAGGGHTRRHCVPAAPLAAAAEIQLRVSSLFPCVLDNVDAEFTTAQPPYSLHPVCLYSCLYSYPNARLRGPGEPTLNFIEFCEKKRSMNETKDTILTRSTRRIHLCHNQLS